MKRLKTIYKDNLILKYIERSKMLFEPITLYNIFEIERTVQDVKVTLPSFYPPNVYSEVGIDVQEFNGQMKLLESDLSTLKDYAGVVPDNIRTLLFVAHVLRKRFSFISRDVLTRATSLLNSLKSSMDVYMINWKNDTNFQSTDAQVSETMITLTPIIDRYSDNRITFNDVNFNVTASDIESIDIKGDKMFMFTSETSEVFNVNVYTNKPNKVKLFIDIKTTDIETNAIFVDTVMNQDSMFCELLVMVENSSEYISVGKEQVKDILHKFVFDKAVIRKVRLVFESESGKKLANGIMEYSFKIGSIVFKYIEPHTTSTWISRKLIMGSNVRKVSLNTIETIPYGFKSTYMITTDEDETGEPTNWILVEPKNRTTSPFNVISIATQPVRIGAIRPYNEYDYENDNSIPENIVNKWILNPFRKYGLPLYNILDIVEDGMLDGILNNALENTDVDTSRIKLYRGVGDWAISYDDSVYLGTEKDRVYDVSRNSAGAGYEPVLLEMEIHGEDALLNPVDNMELILSFPISNTGKILIIDDENNEYNSKIDAIRNDEYPVGSGKQRCIIELSEPLDRRRRFFVDYHTYIGDYTKTSGNKIVIDTDNLKITYGGIQLKPDLEYVIPSDSSRLFLRPHVSGVQQLGISFSYRIIRSEPFRIFTTHVYPDINVDLTIIPFTEDESKAGNYHLIDGRQLRSNETLVTLTPGHHTIVTTQAHANNTVNSQDVNDITGKHTMACIRIPDDIHYRAFELPLRQVTISYLGNNVKMNDSRAFAYYDGKIYLNRVPEFINPRLLLFEGGLDHITGKELICKKVMYTADGEFFSYIPQPENFIIDIDTIGQETSNSIYLRVDVSKETNSAPATLPSVRLLSVINERVEQ